MMMKQIVAVLLACAMPSSAYDHVASPLTDIAKQDVAAYILGAVAAQSWSQH
jgi:hypothetical protein